MNRFENTTLSQRIAEEIAVRISDGKLTPGARLLEVELTKEFGTSRAPIREALFILEKEGIVERIPRRGVFVKKRPKKELIDLYEVVYRLLEIALTKVMSTYTDEQISKLEHLLEEMETTIQEKQLKRYFGLLEEWQMDIFTFSNNDVLKDLYMKINGQLTPFRFLSLSHSSSLHYSFEEYKEMVSGLKEKNITRILINLKKKEERALSILEKLVDDNGEK